MINQNKINNINLQYGVYSRSARDKNLDFEILQEDFDKEFEIKLMDIDSEQLTIPELEYDVDITLNSQDWSKIMTQMNNFGEKTQIILGSDEEQNIFIKTNGDMGKMQVKIPQDQLQEFAIEDKVKIEIEFSTKFLLVMSEFSSLNSESHLHFSKDFPMKMLLSLDHWIDEDDDDDTINSYIKFYLAPCIGDDDDDDDV